MKAIDTGMLKEKFAALKSNAKAVMVFIAMIFLLDAVLLLRGQFLSVGSLFSQGQKLSEALRSASEDFKMSPTYKIRLADLKKDVEQWNKMIAPEAELPAIIESVSKFADISLVRIINIKPISEGVAVATEKYRRQKISVSAKCGFHQLGRFIALLESSPVFLDIKSLEVRSDSSDYAKQQVTIVLEVILQKE